MAGLMQAVRPSSSNANKVDAEGQLVVSDAERAIEQAIRTKKEAEWASWVDSEYTKCKNARQQFENQWYLNLAFTNGKHWLQPLSVPGLGFRLTTPKAPPWRVRTTINKIRTAVRKECAKLSSSRPIPTVTPATSEDEDFSAARVAEQLLKSEFTTAQFENTYRDWIWWGVVCGVSYMKSYWDPFAEDYSRTPPPQPKQGIDGRPLMGQDGQPIMEELIPLKGKIVVEDVSPFHIYVPDLLTKDLEKQPYVIHCTTRSPLWVKSRFGFTPTCDTKATNTLMDAAYLITKGAEQHHDSVLVKEMWIKPHTHADFPSGGLLTIINGKVVQHIDTWPWPFQEYPFYKYDGIPTGGFYSDSIVVDLIPLNKEYNRTKSQMTEIKNTMGKPKILYQKGSINPRQITSEPGQAIPYLAGYQPPTELRGSEVPSTMPMELDRLTQEFDDLSSQHEISRGNTPNSEISSGTAIAFLQEQDDLALTYQISSIEGAIESLGNHTLKYITNYWDEPRLIRIVGKDDAFEARMWKGSDMRGNSDVKVATGSALPFSKAAKQAMITEFMQLGYIPAEAGMEIMELGGLDKVISEILVDKKQAQRENLKMEKLNPEELMQRQAEFEAQAQQAQASGQPPEPPAPIIPVNSWDNHEAHIQFHNMFRKTQTFELLHPLVKREFELHCQVHQHAMSGNMQGETGMLPQQLSPEEAAMQQQGGQGGPEMDPELMDDAIALEQAAKQREVERAEEEATVKMRRDEENHELGILKAQADLTDKEVTTELKAAKARQQLSKPDVPPKQNS